MKTLFLVCSLILLTSCTFYTEKQSEALSQSSYAVNDSIEHGRFDLAEKYSEQVVRIVKPPKKRIVINPVLENLPSTTRSPQSPDTSSSSSTNSTPSLSIYSSSPSLSEKRRVVIVPEKFKNDPVVAVNSLEYEKLLLDQEIHKQLQKDHENLLKNKQEVDQELNKQERYNSQMIKDLNKMQKQLLEKDLAILKRNIIIAVMGLVMGLGVYLRIKGVL
jgi:DNA primase